MSTSRNRRTAVFRQKSSLAASRAPLGSPGTNDPQSRDLSHTKQPKIRILPRPCDSQKPKDVREAPATVIEDSTLLQSVSNVQKSEAPVSLAGPQPSEHTSSVIAPQSGEPAVLTTDTREMESQRYFRGDDHHHTVVEPPRIPISRAVEQHESPRSMVPVSLEDYVVFKPTTRRDRKESKLSITQSQAQVPAHAESQSSEMLASPFKENPLSVTQRILDEGYEEFKTSMATTHVKLPDAFPNFSEDKLDALFDYPVDINEGNGNLSSTTHRNGDLSVFQWQRTDFCWIYLGRIPKARVAQFAQVLHNIYGNNQQFNMRWHRQARARIVTMVKQFCDPVASLVLDESASSPISRRIYNYQIQHGVPDALSFAQTTHDSQHGSSLFDPITRTHREMQSEAPTSRFYPGVNIAEHSYPPSEPSGHLGNQVVTNNLAADIRHGYRERERQKLMQTGRLSTINPYSPDQFEQVQLGKGNARSFQPSNLSPKTQPRLDYNKSVEQTINRRPMIEDLRRNLFLNPERRTSNSIQALNKDFGLRPRIKTETTTLPNDPLLGQAKYSTSESLCPDKSSEPNLVSEAQRIERPTLKAPIRPYVPSALTDDELRASVPLVPQKLNGPFLTGRGLDPITGAAVGRTPDYPTEQEYNDALDAFWYSGMKSVPRQKEFINRSLAANGDTPESNPEAATAMRVMVPVYENLQSYTMQGRGGVASRPDDYFAKFVAPPEWCINRSMVGNGSGPGKWLSGRGGGGGAGRGVSGGGFAQGGSSVAEGAGLGSAIIPAMNRVQTLLGEAEWTSAPERVGRDPRYRPLTGGFGGIGSGRGRSSRQWTYQGNEG